MRARYWTRQDDNRIRCELCPRLCRLKPGQRGACYVRRHDGEGLELASYGRTSGFAVDPIEKKPLYHFLPGTSILSFGTIGCHLACRHCQNWHLSACQDEDRLTAEGTPDEIAAAARRYGCSSVAFTYNDPIPSLEFVVDVAAACRRRRIATVAVTNGYISPAACGEFFGAMDAANIDLKAFTEAFYRRNCAAHLQPVLDTLRYVARTQTWLEVTNLIIPGENDDADEISRMTEWIAAELGEEMPVHFSAFHPAWRMQDRPPTPRSSLASARAIALRNGLRHVYTGNVYDPEGGETRCSVCGSALIRRVGFEARMVNLRGGSCARCGAKLAGVFA
ncbi:MAG: AmmeMemoRadiSam system radical SAM enzyme [Chthonomonadales bacterium]|nr:AmmeMemoRadiSam system radical SAM enzyme [Chthonomonadales bacterium]